jgi:hypothetical protein
MSQDTLAAGVASAALMRHVEEFAKRIKLSGTPEELESFRYLQSCLDGFGYRTELILHDAYISLPGRASVEVDGAALTSITHSFSRPSPAGGLRGALVDLGEGTEADFAGRDLVGRIVLVQGIASPAVAARASAAGAVGQLHVSPHEHLHEMCISPVWGSPSDSTRAQLPSTVACTISLADGEALRARLAAGKPVEAVLHSEVDTGWRKTPILVAELDAPGAGPDAPFVLFSGHHDTWYYGVMDNGTANATMLETARLLATGREAWQRGLRLCFWSGHSHGRYSSSAWYVDTHWDELERRCVAHVNVDSTGGVGATVMTESMVSPELAELAADAIRAETNQQHSGKRPSRNSDQSFWGIGIPTLFGSLSQQPPSPEKMRNALGWWWHTPHDLIDKIDAANLVRDTRVYVRAIWRLLTDAVLPLRPEASVAALLAELHKLPPSLAAAVPLDALLQRAGALRDRLSDLHGAPEAVNAARLRVCRALVPLDLTEGDRFVHDPALPQPAWPVLRPLRDLARAEPGSDQALFLAVAARRACNRLSHALREAASALAA